MTIDSHSRGTLVLIPTPLGEGALAATLPENALQCIRTLDSFIAEEPKTARAFLKQVGLQRALNEVRIDTLNEHTDAAQLPALLAPMLNGARVGLLSEAGYPAVADPGSGLVALAHASGVKVTPLIGPSSLLLALAASGLNGQGFCFHGYLPVDAAARADRIRELETESQQSGSAQLFIEAPYRNNQMLAALLATCSGTMRLCLATDLTLPQEDIRTLSVDDWKTAVPDLHRRPTVFLLQAAAKDRLSATAAKRSGAPKPRR